MANVAVAAPQSEDSGNGTRNFLIGVIALLSITGLSVGAYFVFRKPKVTASSVDKAVDDTKNAPAKVSNETVPVTSSTVVPTAPSHTSTAPNQTTTAPVKQPITTNALDYFNSISAGTSTKANAAGKVYNIGDRQFGVIVMVTPNNNVIIQSNSDFVAPFYSVPADALIAG